MNDETKILRIYIHNDIYIYKIYNRGKNPQRDVACKIGPNHNLNLFHVNLLNV